MHGKEWHLKIIFENIFLYFFSFHNHSLYFHILCFVEICKYCIYIYFILYKNTVKYIFKCVWCICQTMVCFKKMYVKNPDLSRKRKIYIFVFRQIYSRCAIYLKNIQKKEEKLMISNFKMNYCLFTIKFLV